MGRAAAYIATTLIGRLAIRSDSKKRKFANTMVSTFARWVLAGLDVQVRALNVPSTLHTGRPHFFVANHLSDIDILALASVTPMVFITSVELRDLSFLGTLAKLGGCIFVERRNKFKVLEEMKHLARLLWDGFDVLLFAEGTSSNGQSVLPFKNTLMQAAIDSEAILVPVCINYLSIDGEPPNATNRDKVFYYGDMGFTAHLWRLLHARRIEVECRFLAPIPLTKHDTRKDISNRAWSAISKNYKAVT
jgi:1-acyl-sn-glycerol-3-phosphate acyltransferase